MGFDILWVNFFFITFRDKSSRYIINARASHNYYMNYISLSRQLRGYSFRTLKPYTCVYTSYWLSHSNVLANNRTSSVMKYSRRFQNKERIYI